MLPYFSLIGWGDHNAHCTIAKLAAPVVSILASPLSTMTIVGHIIQDMLYAGYTLTTAEANRKQPARSGHTAP